MRRPYLVPLALIGMSALIGCAATESGDATRVQRSPSSATQANFHAPSDLTAPDSSPQGISGNNVYDQPGALPPNSGGTNAGRAGDDVPD